MDDQAPLSELCSICYVDRPKYRCPRCKTRTCSLSCYKKHQQRASCSGKRDPAAYLKKNQLATPSGLDRDYNYLKNVERSIDHAGQDAHDRGFGVSTTASKNVTRGWRVDSALQRYLAENRITVERAPKGMSRQKNNQTRPTKSNRIVWTVEWLHGTGERFTSHDCAESDPVTNLYETYQAEKHSAGRKSKSSKRKRSEVDATEQDRAMNKPRDEPDKGAPEPKIANVAQTATASPLQSGGGASVEVLEAKKTASRQADTLRVVLAADEPQTVVVEVGRNTDMAESDAVHTDSQLHFYLLRPATSSASKVVVPLRSKATLTECMRDQVVQEYPTIVVLKCSPQKLQDGFVLHEDYVKSRRGEEAELQELLSASGSKGTELAPSRYQPSAAETEELDAQSILNMLKRDVRS